jgi:hypothetical protein
MKRLTLFYVATLVLLALTPAAMKTQDVGVITIRLSYKVVLNPNGGTRPPGVTDAHINTAVNQMNDLMRGYLRGYRFQLVEILDVGGNGQTTGPSQWYNTDFFASDGGTMKDQMQADAMADAAYQWRTNAINLYLTNGICGGICSFPGGGDQIVIIGGCFDGNGPLQLHEIGHYFNLCHTQGCPCGGCTADMIGICHTVPGDDGIADTLPDLECWDQDNIAMHSFGRNYSQLTPAEQNQVDDVFFNIMSYHSNASRLTEQQLDRWSQSANLDRVAVRTGRMIFAQAGAPAGGNGSPASPYNTVAGAAGAAASDTAADIIILRPGSFNEAVTISTPVTLRATRQGAAVVGSSAPPVLAASGVEGPKSQSEVSRGEPYRIAPRLGFAGSGNKKQ